MPREIGGWLYLLGFGVILTPFTFLTEMLDYYKDIDLMLSINYLAFTLLIIASYFMDELQDEIDCSKGVYFSYLYRHRVY